MSHGLQPGAEAQSVARWTTFSWLLANINIRFNKIHASATQAVVGDAEVNEMKRETVLWIANLHWMAFRVFFIEEFLAISCFKSQKQHLRTVPRAGLLYSYYDCHGIRLRIDQLNFADLRSNIYRQNSFYILFPLLLYAYYKYLIGSLIPMSESIKGSWSEVQGPQRHRRHDARHGIVCRAARSVALPVQAGARGWHVSAHGHRARATLQKCHEGPTTATRHDVPRMAATIGGTARGSSAIPIWSRSGTHGDGHVPANRVNRGSEKIGAEQLVPGAARSRPPGAAALRRSARVVAACRTPASGGTSRRPSARPGCRAGWRTPGWKDDSKA